MLVGFSKSVWQLNVILLPYKMIIYNGRLKFLFEYYWLYNYKLTVTVLFKKKNHYKADFVKRKMKYACRFRSWNHEISCDSHWRNQPTKLSYLMKDKTRIQSVWRRNLVKKKKKKKRNTHTDKKKKGKQQQQQQKKKKQTKKKKKKKKQ